MDDLIKREDAIEAVKEILSGNVYWDYVCDAVSALSALPSAEAVQGDAKMIPIELKKRYPHSRDEDITDAFMRGYQSAKSGYEWIPCSERLPSESGWYLITVQGCEKVTDMEWYYVEWDAWNGVSSEQQVLAWMPLPKPYREDGE